MMNFERLHAITLARNGRRGLSLATALVCVLPVHAQMANATRLFEQGNNMYAEGAYREALSLYEQAQSYGYSSGALLLNAGNAHYRLDHRGQALRYYEKALRLLGEEPHLLHNLELVRAQVASPYTALPVPIWQQWWQSAVGNRSPWLFFAVGALFYGAAFILFAYRLWTQRRSPWQRRARTATLFVAAALILLAYGASLGTGANRTAIIVATSAALTEEPGGPAMLELSEGVKVDILQTVEHLTEVRLPNGARGYVATESLGEI